MSRHYLTLYSTSKPSLGVIGVFDIDAKKWISNRLNLTLDIDMEADLAAFGFGECYFQLSKFKDLGNATFSRNRDGVIRKCDLPTKLSVMDAVALVANTSYKSSTAQLSNLKLGGLTPQNHYVRRVTVFTESVLQQVSDFQNDGFSLKKIAGKLDLNYASLSATLRKARAVSR